MTFKVCFYSWQLQNILIFSHFSSALFSHSIFRTLFYPFFPTPFQCLWLYFPGLQTARPEVVGAGSRAGTQLGVVGVCVCLCTLLWVRKSVRMCAVILCVCVCNWEMEGWKMRRGGPQGWRRRADRRCSDTRRLEELLIFSHVPRGHRCVSAFALFCSLSQTHIPLLLYTHKLWHTYYPLANSFSSKHTLTRTLTHPGPRHEPTCGSVSGNVPVLNHKTSPLKQTLTESVSL